MADAVTFAIHVRYDGRSYEFGAGQLDVGELSTDAEILAAVGQELNGDLTGYVVDRAQTGDITVRPQAVFG